jgi:anaerobic selenocysteine-containing dehydrogenase
LTADEQAAGVAGVLVDGVPRAGFNTPSRRLEFYSPTLAAWGWPEHAVPRYVPGHVHWRDLKREEGEFDLLPNFRLPTLIHTRSAVKWLYEISHANPLWISTADARQHGIKTGDLVKLRTKIGFFVTRAWVTEGIRPGVLGMSHHLGRWRLKEEAGGSRTATALVSISFTRASSGALGEGPSTGLRASSGGTYRMRQQHGARPFASNDPDSQRIWWNEIGVHQNLTFPVQPDPVSGMHCWHQRVRLERAGPDDRYGDIEVDTEKAHEAYKEWMQRTRPAPGPDGSRRPSWFDRPLRPVPAAYRIPPKA